MWHPLIIVIYSNRIHWTLWSMDQNVNLHKGQKIIHIQDIFSHDDIVLFWPEYKQKWTKLGIHFYKIFKMVYKRHWDVLYCRFSHDIFIEVVRLVLLPYSLKCPDFRTILSFFLWVIFFYFYLFENNDKRDRKVNTDRVGTKSMRF